jgi:hypothetical protein
VVLTLPIMYLSVALGFAYTKAFKNKLEGYFCGFFFISVGVISGAIIVLFLSRYLFNKTIRKRYLNHH